MRNEGLTQAQRKSLEQEAKEIDAKRLEANQAGNYRQAHCYAENVLDLRRRMYPGNIYKDGHPDLASSLNELGFALQSLGQADKALPYYDDALAMYRKLYPKEKYPDGHADLARSLNNMGSVLQSLGRPGEALTYYHDTLAMCRKLYPNDKYPHGHRHLARCQNNIGSALNELGQNREALSFYDDALGMCRQLYPESQYPDGHPLLATGLNNMGFTLESMGRLDQALTFYEAALVINRKLYPKDKYLDGHSSIAINLNNLGCILSKLGEPAKALPYNEAALTMFRQLYPEDEQSDGHPELFNSLNNMASLLDTLGDGAKALSHYASALAMCRKLYPKDKYPSGHADLARSLSNMGTVLERLGHPDKALSYYDEALVMRRKLYPKDKYPSGHLDLAYSLNNISSALGALGRYDNALLFCDDAVTTYRQHYPKDEYPAGHPDLALSLNNIGVLLQAMGRHDEALLYSDDALGMQRQLYPKSRYPDGHPNLALSLNNMGRLLLLVGKLDDAVSCLDESINMGCAVINRFASVTSDATTLASLRELRVMSNPLLSALRADPTKLAAVYARLWKMRAPLLNALRTRHDGALVQLSDSVARKQWNRLTTARAAISRLMTKQTYDFDARDQALAELDDELEKLQRDLTPLLPSLKRDEELASASLKSFAAKLPTHSAFIEFIRYVYKETGQTVDRKYVAFIVAPNQEPVCVDLDNAQPIDDAIDSWRASIDSREASKAPAYLRRLVWDPVAKQLPPETMAVYLCPDGNLARMPFAALPGRAEGTVLLEDYALATIPSGPFLLEQLLFPRTYPAGENMFAVGNVCYGDGNQPYIPLNESGSEAKRAREAFGVQPDDFLSGHRVTRQAVADGLRTARYAHLATHGYFEADDLTEERKRFANHLKAWQAELENSRGRVGVGTRNPLGYVGLALAGANDPKAGGILTGLDIIDMPLEGLKLCVLSACETGLGELTEGEGVAGLQRAFHVAGCPNVVGSLWNVNDKATAALMAQFYHEHMANKQPIIEALRRAQLTVYRHPEKIEELAGDRARIANVADAARLGPKVTYPNGVIPPPRTSPTKLWAAFVLSGLGN